ncbi:MAG TPA: four helix bundle protein [Prolixibacteraceae bacterium]|nr:four helix bundle protein [Prolixibacteraceae bacterium]HPR59487.1 four helix bundle protein [Prolixibacteraceae bacterium]
MERRNINRGFTQLRVWQDAINLYVLTCKHLSSFPFELIKTSGNAIDAAHSIGRNIAEGYCRKSIREYLNFLNIALASSGEFHSSMYSFKAANQVTENTFEEIDELHYKTENELIALIKSINNKMKNGTWNETLQ